MADRQDIDALMVGALYGELDTAERSRLDAHLSSHPEDRVAMQGLEAARATVRRGMTELAPADPPQAVSAILLQEAARRRAPTVSATEPAEREGLWERFVAWFRPLAGHPALAGAAALILVAGTATALWVRGKGKVTEPTTSSTTARAELKSTPPGTTNGADTSTGYEVAGVADPNADELHQDKDTAGSAPADDRQPARMASGSGTSGSGGGKGATRGRKPGGGEMGIAVEGHADVPPIKELEEEQLARETGDAVGDDAADGYRNSTTSGGVVAPQPEPAAVDPKLEEWAQQQHGKLVKLVKEGNCPEAGRVGSDLKAKAPDYYAANVANDRDVRQCKQYIEKQAKKKAEKDYKSRSQGNAYDDAETDATE